MEKIAFLNDPTIIASAIACFFALFSGVMAFYTHRSKKKFEVKLDKDIETHRSWLEGKNKEIQSQLDTKLELLRIEYGTVFTKRLEVIEEIYINLLQVQELYTILYLRDKSKELDEKNAKRIMEISNNYTQFLGYFKKKKIYLSEDLATAINGFLFLVNAKLYEKYPDEMNEALNVSNKNVSEKELSVVKGSLKEFLNIAEFTPAEVLDILENEFRTLIGVEIASKNIKN